MQDVAGLTFLAFFVTAFVVPALQVALGTAIAAVVWTVVRRRMGAT